MANLEGKIHGVIIVGGGICGLATALALQRKGIRCLVLERAESLRATGAGISIHANGWRAFNQLKVGDELRKLAVALSGMDKREIHSGRTTVVSYRTEVRCLKRSDLVEILAKQLPAGSIRFNCQVEAISLEPITRFPIVFTSHGTTIKAKLVIGCDGSNSVVAKFLGLKATKSLPIWAARGFTTYPGGHHYGNRFQQLIAKGINFRLIPINDKIVCFNALIWQPPKECTGSKDVKLIWKVTLQMMQGFPEEILDIVRRCDDITSLSFTQLCYRAPWHMILEKFQEGMVTVAGDAMHVMGPFLGQGGSCGLEDAIVLARCLAKTTSKRINDTTNNDWKVGKGVNEGIRLYVKERRWRILMLSLQTFLVGSLIGATSRFKKMLITAVMAVLFRAKYKHNDYNCGPL